MMRFRRCALFTFWMQSNVRLWGLHVAEAWWLLWGWFYDSSEQEVAAAAAVNMKAGRDVKHYLVSALGNINHTLFGSVSLWCPLSPVVGCELMPGETRAEAAGSQWKRGMAGLCPCMSLVRPQQQRPELGHDGRREGREFNHSGGFF